MNCPNCGEKLLKKGTFNHTTGSVVGYLCIGKGCRSFYMKDHRNDFEQVKRANPDFFASGGD